MKVACIGYFQSVGGAEKQLVLLANSLVERGHEVYLFILADNRITYTIDDRVRIIDLCDGEQNAVNRVLFRYKMLKMAYKRVKPDVSIHYWLQSAYLSALMKKSITGKVIYSERGDPGDAEYDGILGMIRTLAFKRVDGFIFQSEGARDYFKDSIRRKSVVIHNPVMISPSKYPSPCTQRVKKIVNVGRLHPQKNQRMLIEAFSRISKKFEDFRLEIFGEGELKSDLEEIIDKKSLQGKVLLKGTTSDIYDEVYNASVFVLSSDYEGMPNALLEAMALGVPCISTDCKPGGARTLIKNRKNGFIVKRNDVNALAIRMSQILSDCSLANKLAIEARKVLDSHSSAVIFSEYEKFIFNVTEKTERRHKRIVLW